MDSQKQNESDPRTVNKFAGVYLRVTTPSEREQLYPIATQIAFMGALEDLHFDAHQTGEFIVCATIDMPHLRISGYGYSLSVLMESYIGPLVENLVACKANDGREYKFSERDTKIDSRSPEILRCSKRVGIALKNLEDAKEDEFISPINSEKIRQFQRENPDKVLHRVVNPFQSVLMMDHFYWTKASETGRKLNLFALGIGEFDITLDTDGVPIVSAQPGDIELEQQHLTPR